MSDLPKGLLEWEVMIWKNFNCKFEHQVFASFLLPDKDRLFRDPLVEEAESLRCILKREAMGNSLRDRNVVVNHEASHLLPLSQREVPTTYDLQKLPDHLVTWVDRRRARLPDKRDGS